MKERARVWELLGPKVPGMCGLRGQRLVWEPVTVEQVHAHS